MNNLNYLISNNEYSEFIELYNTGNNLMKDYYKKMRPDIEGTAPTPTT